MARTKASAAISAIRDDMMKVNQQVQQWSPYKALDMVPSGAGNVAAYCSFKRAREYAGIKGGIGDALAAIGVVR